MAYTTKHIPILCNEIEQIIQKLSCKTIVDCTFGSGGHAKIFLKHHCIVYAFDYDNNINEISISEDEEIAQAIANKQLIFIHDNFANIANYNIPNIDFIWADLGLSSMQLDELHGISFMSNTPLQMCCDKNTESLHTKINQLSRAEIKNILEKYGDICNSNTLANNIYTYIILHTIQTTQDLLLATNLQIKHHRSLIAQVFQAFRIYNNNELYNLMKLMEYIEQNNINFAIIAFHSLEVRIIKRIEKQYQNHGFIQPSLLEKQSNSRSYCAIMRYGYNNTQ